MAAASGMSARAKVRPGELAADAGDASRIARLERFVEHLDRDVDELHRIVDQKSSEAVAEAKRADDQLRQEIEQRDKERRTALRPSLQRQAIGAASVFVGIVLGMIGDLT
jgi:hypothetical protein